MKERREEVVTIKDATMEDVEQLVAYVYSGTTEEPYDRFKDLLALADKYQVPELVKFCSFKVADSLSEENALELGIYGETHNANILVEMCAQFIATNMKNSLDEDDWMERIKESQAHVGDCEGHERQCQDVRRCQICCNDDKEDDRKSSRYQ